MSDLEVFSQPVTHCLHAIAFSRMVAGRIEMDARLAGNVHRLLGGLSGNIGVDTQGDGLLDVCLRPPGAPCDTLHRTVAACHMQRLSFESLLNDAGKIIAGCGGGKAPHIADTARVAGLQPALDLDAETLGELGVVAQFGVAIERQMVGKQTDPGIEKELDTLVAEARDARVFVAPEITMMDQNRVRTAVDSGFHQCLARRDPRYHPLDLVTSLDLKAVGAIVLEGLGLEQPLQLAFQFGTMYHDPPLSRKESAPHKGEKTALQDNADMKAATSFLKPVMTGLVVAGLAIVLREMLTTRHIVLVEAAPPAITAPTLAGQASWADAVEAARPAVVNIYTSKIVTRNSPPPFDDPAVRRFFGMQDAPQRERLQGSLGSGVVVSASGYVLTNHHVIAGADEIRVALEDGREAMASVIGTDPGTDLAVLFIEMTDLPSITLEASDNGRIGDIVLAIGNPFGVGQTVTQGIISALGRNQNGLSTLVDFIQTDAAINPGNSGGALINTQGHLIGINTAIYSKTGTTNGIGFAIPVSLAKSVLESLVREGTVIRGWLGISPQIMTETLANALHIDYAQGLLVAGVYTDGPAAVAGVRPGDILLKIDGQLLHEPREALNYITSRKPGDHVTLEVFRSGQVVSVDAVVGTRPEPAA